MSTAIKPVRPPSPKRLKELSQLALIGNAFLDAAGSELFNASERGQFAVYARAYFGYLREEAPAKLALDAPAA